LISAEAIKNNLNKSNKHLHHINNSKLGNATVLTATSQSSAIAASNTQPKYTILMNLLPH